jgi:PAS domain S-box-containing protein
MSRRPSMEELERRVAELEAELAEARRVGEALVHAPFGLFMVDLEGRIVAANAGGARHLGSKLPDVIGTRLRDHFPHEVAMRRRERGLQVFASGTGVTFEDAVGDNHYLVTMVPIFDEDHRPKYLAIYGIDVTERVWVERSLRRSRELLRAQRDLALALSQARSYPETLRLCLETAIGLSGLDAGALFLADPEKGDLELVCHQGVRDTLVERYRRMSTATVHARALESREPQYTCRDQLDEATQEALVAEGLRAVAVLPIQHEGRPLGCATFASHTLDEVPEAVRGSLETVAAQAGEAIARARAEEALRASEARLQQAQKLEAIGTLAGGIAHDFNNLLMGIQGNASLMQLETLPGDKILGRLRSIEECVRSGTELTRQLLGFARSGRFEVRPTDLNELIERTSSLFGRTRKDITVGRALSRDLWVVDADRGQLEQVLLNLYVNAWQAMPNGGELRIETRNLVVGEHEDSRHGVPPARYVVVSVTDTGVGMDEATQHRVFEPFFTTKEVGRGTGLGLAMVYGIVKSHGGLVAVESAPGAGATFTLYLPASTRSFTVEPTSKSRETLRGTETILLVDDEAIVLDVGKSMLEALGYSTLVAQSGADAIEVYERHREQIRVVVLDMVMPGLGGAETLERLKAIDPNVRVLLSSGYGLNDAARATFQRGCKAFIQKPFTLDDLSWKIREALEA